MIRRNNGGISLRAVKSSLNTVALRTYTEDTHSSPEVK